MYVNVNVNLYRATSTYVKDFPFFCVELSLTYSIDFHEQDSVLARMAVPKMVKNGFNSVLHVSAVFRVDRYSQKSRTDMKPKLPST